MLRLIDFQDGEVHTVQFQTYLSLKYCRKLKILMNTMLNQSSYFMLYHNIHQQMGNYCCEEKSNNEPKHLTHSKRRSTESQQGYPANQRTSQKVYDQPDPIVPLKRKGPEKYQSVKYLGRGTFGDVVVTQDKETHQIYAMKIIEKRRIKQFNLLQCEIIKKISKNSLFVKIKQTFQNESRIYLVMEYLKKGDLYYYSKKRKQCIFTETIIKNLVSEIVAGIEILHNQGIIYRELKPENILVTQEGHIKLTDYGLSKVIIEDKHHVQTFVGTFQYAPPEVFKGNYGKQIDLWALGIIMFELRFENNLFESFQYGNTETTLDSFENFEIEEILNGIVGLISQNFRDILIKLLEKDPKKRITIDSLKGHAFFDGIDWEKVKNRENEPPLEQFVNNDHIKFRDPTNEIEISHRRIHENKKQEFNTKLYEFRASK